MHVVITRTYMDYWPRVDTDTGGPLPSETVAALDEVKELAYNNRSALYQLSRTSVAAGDAKARAYFSERVLAGTGDAVCMYEHAQSLLKKRKAGPAIDLIEPCHEARLLIESAAADRHPQALLDLGRCAQQDDTRAQVLATNLGIQKTLLFARKYYGDLALLNVRPGLHNLARMHEFGQVRYRVVTLAGFDCLLDYSPEPAKCGACTHQSTQSVPTVGPTKCGSSLHFRTCIASSTYVQLTFCNALWTHREARRTGIRPKLCLSKLVLLTTRTQCITSRACISQASKSGGNMIT